MSASKDQAKYWRPRLKIRPGCSGYYIRLMHDNKQRWIPLDTSNKDLAATEAARMYMLLRREGCVAIQKPKEEAEEGHKELTVGRFLEIAEPLISGEEKYRTYSERLVKIVKRIQGIPIYAGKEYHPEKAAESKRQALLKPLSILNPDMVEEYKAKFLKEGGSKSTLNSDLRCAKALFPKPVLRKAGISNPFDGVQRATVARSSYRYRSQFSLSRLLAKWKEELAKCSEPEEKQKQEEEWLCLLLASGTGGRKRELDLLKWEDIDLKNGTVSFHGDHLKNEVSERTIPVSPRILNHIAEFKPEDGVGFILAGRAENPPLPKNGGSRPYRCKGLFNRVIKRLKEYREGGKTPIDVRNPIHTIRKEVGSIHYKESKDIYATKTYLGHEDIKTTIEYYADSGTPEAPTIDF